MKQDLISLLTVLLTVLMSILFPESVDAPVAAEYLFGSSNALTVHFIDVGQADCILLESGGEFVIIDGGNVDDGQMVVSYLKQQGVKRLSAVVCSHAHEDHVGGLPAVLSVFDTEAVYSPVKSYDSDVFADFVSKAKFRGQKLKIPKPGDTFSFGLATVTVLGPVRQYAEPNNTSLVLMVSYGESRFLFTGDMEREAENHMLDYWGDRVNWEAEVLKVGHHCSDTSSGYRFVYEVNPTYGVISVGKDNSYGHPHYEPLSRLKDAGLVLFRTDLLGHVIAATDGHEIRFVWENQKAAPAEAQPAEPRVFYGNKKSGLLHAADCQSIPSAKNRIEFTDYSEAIAQGYKPCGSCLE